MERWLRLVVIVGHGALVAIGIIEENYVFAGLWGLIGLLWVVATWLAYTKGEWNANSGTTRD